MEKKIKTALVVMCVTLIIIATVLIITFQKHDDTSKFIGKWKLENPYPIQITNFSEVINQTWTFYSNSSMKFYYYEFTEVYGKTNYTIWLPWKIENDKLYCEEVFTYKFSEEGNQLTLLPMGGTVNLVLNKIQ